MAGISSSMTQQDYAVILTAYNSEEVIATAINSALNLSPAPKQIVIVDDGSSDKTVSIIDELAKQNEKIHFYRHNQNLGPSAARNYAISRSKYEVCLIMDSDDVSAPFRGIEHLRMHNDGSDVTFVSSQKKYKSGYIFEAQNQSITNVKLESRKMMEALLGLRSLQIEEVVFIPACTMSIKKSFFLSLNGFDENLRRNEDADLVIRAARQGAAFSFSNQICVSRFDSSSSMKGGIIDVENERSLMLKYARDLSVEDRDFLEIKLNFRELYFHPTFFSALRVLNYPSFKFLIFNLPILFRRTFHDLKKR
jgi:glycosyltransferase involved in cell wall biosynthesis